jgi:hypothetical protein
MLKTMGSFNPSLSQQKYGKNVDKDGLNPPVVFSVTRFFGVNLTYFDTALK